MSRYRVSPPANDEGKPSQIRVQGLESPPLTVAEVEIFDALISNVDELTAALQPANDNEGPSPRENTP